MQLVCAHLAHSQHHAATVVDNLISRAQLWQRAATSAAAAASTSAASSAASEKRLAAEAAARYDAWCSRGRECNASGDFAGARDFFEHAYVAQPRIAALISLANMQLKLHEPEIACEIYRRVSSGTPSQLGAFVTGATPKEVEMAERKLAETSSRLAPLHEVPTRAAAGDAPPQASRDEAARLMRLASSVAFAAGCSWKYGGCRRSSPPSAQLPRTGTRAEVMRRAWAKLRRRSTRCLVCKGSCSGARERAQRSERSSGHRRFSLLQRWTV